MHGKPADAVADSFIRRTVGALILSLVVPTALGAPPIRAAPLARPYRHETPPDTFRPTPRPRHVVPALPPAALRRGQYQSVQVNVDELGNNIVGDAANEPSLAVHPHNPNRLVIGWRQFDTVESSFREAGWGYSSDAGRSWKFAGVLVEGEFRTDPVLDVDSQDHFYYHSLVGTALDQCDVSKSLDAGVSWLPPVPAYGGDKNWLVVDRTGGLGEGNIYTIWQRFYSCCGDHTFTRSTDGGASFIYPIHIPSNPSFGTLAVGPDGALYAIGIEAITFQDYEKFVIARSTDAQDPAAVPTFTTTVVNLGGKMLVNIGYGPNPDGLLGQAQVVVDRSDGPTHGNVYALGSVDPSGIDPLDVMFIRSTDGGQTWSAPLRVNDDPQAYGHWQWFGTIAVAPNGRIDVIWNDTRKWAQALVSEVYYAYSVDAGITWSPNEPITPQFKSDLGYPQQKKLGDYYHMISDDVGANLAYAATFNFEQDIYFVRIGDYDCNGNGVGDAQDIAGGLSTDVNGNGIPDECEGLGDLNCDGAVNAFDIDPFVLALTDPEGYVAAYPNCHIEAADATGDGAIDAFDIDSFVVLLTHG